MEKKFKLETTSFFLHIIAMIFMLCDHMWGTIVSGNDWLTCIGRLAFPIFAFLIVEGYFHTKNFKKYMKRLLIFALITEIPFNLAIGGNFLYPFHQNVLWTFLIALTAIHLLEKIKNKKIWLKILLGILIVIFSSVLGLLTMVDYYHYGILTVLIFYFFRGKKWWNYLGQLICLWYINVEMMGGMYYEINLLGKIVEISQQGLALFALIPIWLYKGKQGPYNKTIKYIYYAFYPVHLLILAIIGFFVL